MGNKLVSGISYIIFGIKENYTPPSSPFYFACIKLRALARKKFHTKIYFFGNGAHIVIDPKTNTVFTHEVKQDQDAQKTNE